MLLPTPLLAFFPLLVSACPHHARDPATPPVPPASELITKGIAALGGSSALESLSGITYHVPNHFRTTTLMQSYSPFKADKAIATAGNQNISFSFSDQISQRIDRFHYISDDWIWASPTLEPMNSSLVVKGGDSRYACYLSGNNMVFLPREVPGGCADPVLAQWMVNRAEQMSPTLLSRIKPHLATSSIATLRPGVTMPAVHDPALRLTVFLDPKTYLPHTIRSSTGDLRVYNYTSVAGVKFPRRFLLLQEDHVIEDFRVSTITTNPSFTPEFFAAPQRPPIKFPGVQYTQSQVAAFSLNMLPTTPFTGTLGNLTITHPLPGAPKLYHLNFVDAPGYKQLVLEFEDAVIVADAPPLQSLLVLQWVKEKLGKKVTHCWITHHHGDHAAGAADFVNAGAKLVVPEVARRFWEQSISGAEIVTFTDEKPYTHHSSTMQLRVHWAHNSVHAEDWTYAHITTEEAEAVFLADVWTPGQNPDDGVDIGAAREWLHQALGDGVARNAVVLPAHGVPTPLKELVELTGFDYLEGGA